jgi:hypothetical protein
LFPPHEPVTVGKALQSLKKFEAAEAWNPAFAGTAKAEVTPHLCLVFQRSAARSAEVSMPDSRIYQDLPDLI